MSMEGTTGPGTSPVAFPPAPIMPVPGEDERDGSPDSLREAVARGVRHDHVPDDVPDSPWTAADVVEANRIGADEDSREALERLRRHD